MGWVAGGFGGVGDLRPAAGGGGYMGIVGVTTMDDGNEGERLWSPTQNQCGLMTSKQETN